MIKAVFFDIDGTLIPMNTGKIPDSTLEALHILKEKGVSLYIATGRPPGQLTLLDKRCTGFAWDGYLFMNGQYCVDAKGEVFRKEPIRTESLKVLVPWLKEHATSRARSMRSIIPTTSPSTRACMTIFPPSAVSRRCPCRKTPCAAMITIPT